jgi:hypothetical protein
VFVVLANAVRMCALRWSMWNILNFGCNGFLLSAVQDHGESLFWQHLRLELLDTGRLPSSVVYASCLVIDKALHQQIST